MAVSKKRISISKKYIKKNVTFSSTTQLLLFLSSTFSSTFLNCLNSSTPILSCLHPFSSMLMPLYMSYHFQILLFPSAKLFLDIIKDTNRKKLTVSKGKKLPSRANFAKKKCINEMEGMKIKKKKK